MQSTYVNESCFICNSQHIISNVIFSCGHCLCINCLYRTISINEIKELENLNTITFMCPCNKGSSVIKIEECLSLFKTNSNFYENKNIVPIFKRKNSWTFRTQGDLDSYIQIIETKFRDKWSSELNLRLGQFDELQKLLDEMKASYIEKMNQQFKKGIALFSILQIVYRNFFNDLNCDYSDKSSLLHSIVQKNKLALKEIKLNINNNHQNSDFDIIKDKLNSFYYHIKLAFDFNFKNKEILSTNVLNAHSESIFALAPLADNKIASGSNDKLIKIWDMHRMICIKVLEGHLGSVLSLRHLKDSRLASGSGDKTIKIWNLEHMTVDMTLRGHDSEVYALAQMKNEKLISGSGDKTIRIWDLNEQICEKVLTGHSRSIYSLCAMENGIHLCSGSVDWKIAVWDLNNKNDNNVQVLNGHSGSINCLIQLIDGRVASGSSDTTIKIWNIFNLCCEATINGSKSGIMSMLQLSDGRIVAGASQSLLFYSIEGKNLIQSVNGHSKNVNAIIDVGNDIIVSGSGDKNILIWDLSR